MKQVRRAKRVHAIIGGAACAAACAVSCAGGSERAPGDARSLDCAWIRDPGNCWRTFASAVDACLGEATQVGTIDQDGRTCLYPSGARTVSFHAKMPWPVPSGSPGVADLHFSVSSGARTCLEQFETQGTRGFRAVGPQGIGSFELKESNGRATTSCPDGSKFEGNAEVVFGGACGDASVAPGTEWTTSELHFVHRLAGARSVVFDCYRQRPPK